MTKKSQRTDFFILSSRANAAYLSKQHVYLLLNTLSLVQVEGSEPANAGYIHFRMNFWRKKQLSFEQFNQVQFDAGRGLTLRQLSGISLRWLIHSGEKTELACNSGSMIEYEQWKGSPSSIDNIFLKSTTNVSLRVEVIKNINLFLISYYQGRFTNFFRPRITSDARIQFKIIEKLSLDFQFESTYDAAPIIDIKRHIYTIKNNLNYTF
ncbi:MAG: DUF481 domain-containing protein [Cyclobacteriaceae bacterium]